MTNTFHTVAQNIIQESIKSAIFIDDQIPMLFSEEEGDTGKLCKPLYESFHENDCSLDFFKFVPNWENKKRLLFERKDLLILDWELNLNEPKYSSTLEIIDKAITTDNLHFVCIYSNSNDQVYDIFYKILAFYSGNDKENADYCKTELIDLLEESGEISEDIFEQLRVILKDLALGNYSGDLGAMNKKVSQILGKNNAEFRKITKKYIPKNKSFDEFARLGFILNEENLYKLSFEDVYIKCDARNNYLQINNTIFAIFHKREHKAETLYNQFCKAIIEANENFLSLMSLELRNKVLRHSGFIGKELSKIKERAFFHHMDNIQPQIAFEEYLIDLWKYYNTGFLYTDRPKLFEVLDEYKKDRGDDTLPIIDDLARLNYYYNIHYNVTNNRNVVFGDIFKVKRGENEEYLLCITPHCDCLNPSKINGFYYFVKGSKVSIERGLELADSGYTSFIKINGEEIICIEWRVKPFTLYLCEEQRNVGQSNKITYGDHICNFEFITTIKENYAQRIANKAFFYPLRVGISFAKRIPGQN